jgi:hypothetical protein
VSCLMAARTTDQTAPDDPVLGLIAKRKAEALARAEKEHAQLAAAAKLWAQGTKTVTDAEEHLRKGREKQDAAVAAMLGAGLDAAGVAETLGIAPKAVSEAAKRHRTATEGPAPEKPAAKAPARAPRAAKAVEPDPKVADPAPKSVEPIPKAAATSPTPAAPPADEAPGAETVPAEDTSVEDASVEDEAVEDEAADGDEAAAGGSPGAAA